MTTQNRTEYEKNELQASIDQALILIEQSAQALYRIESLGTPDQNLRTNAEKNAQREAVLWTAEAMDELSKRARTWATRYAREAVQHRGASTSDAAAALSISRQAAAQRLN